jgi:undecaprenyl-diphosphatase
MTFFQSILLGIVQGLTEFLPISSSGHLVIVPYILGWDIPPQDAFIFDVLVQVATIAAVIAYFWSDLLIIARALFQGIKTRKPMADPNSQLGIYILIATLPAGLIGFVFKDLVEQAFNSPIATGFFLLVTAALLFLAERASNRRRNLDQINWKDALWIGLFQALAVFPGVSRSGSTIAGGMVRNLDREPAARFSFLIYIPIMVAAGALALIDLASMPSASESLIVFATGMLTSAITGYLAIRWLLRYLTRHRLYVFAVYCGIIGILTLAVSLIRL